MKLGIEAVIRIVVQLLVWLRGWVVGWLENWRVMLVLTQDVVKVDVDLGNRCTLVNGSLLFWSVGRLLTKM